MKTIEVVIDGEATTFRGKRRISRVKTKLKPGWKAFGKEGEETAEQFDARKMNVMRERLRKKLLALARKALIGGKRKVVDFAKLKIVYELLLKDEAAEAEKQKAEVKAAAVVTQAEMNRYVRGLLGKEITL